MLRRIAATIVPSPVTDASRRGSYPLMDSIRALAAVFIFLYHCSREFRLGETGIGLADTFVVGVPVFFVVSGFLLYRPFALAHLEGRPPAPLRAYAWRRALRIVPAFWVALTLVLLLGDQAVGAGEIPLLYAFAQVYDPDTAMLGIGQAWSLNDEVVFYALIPLVMLAVRGWGASTLRSRLRLELAGLAALLVAAVAFKAWALGWGDQNSAVGGVFLLHPGWNLDLFVLGMGLAVWSAERQVAGRRAGVAALAGTRPGLLWLAAAAVFVLVGLERDRFATDGGLLAIHAAQGLCAALVVAPAITGSVRECALRRRVLANRGLLALGVLSYGFYLWHLVVVRAVFDLDGPFSAAPGPLAAGAQVVVAFAGSVALAMASWLLVERPALSLKRLVGRPAPVTVGPAPAGDRAVPAGADR